MLASAKAGILQHWKLRALKTKEYSMNSIEINFKELILLYITIVGFVAYVPQIVKLIKDKNADGCSILTWLFWLTNSCLYLVYLLLSEVTIWLILSQVTEVLLIGVTFTLIVIIQAKTKLKN